jgi:hypothetical protein
MKFKNYIETESGIKDTSTSPGTAGQLLSSTVAGTSWIDQNTISSGTSETIDIQVKNISSANGGINLSKGDPVYIYGSVGASARLYVDLADADSTATNNLGDSKMPCVALLDQDLSPNGEGTATVVGKLRNLITNPIDGNVPNENDTVYVKSGGGLTLTKPTGSTNLIQNVGQVGRVSTSADGNIVVAALLRSNDIPNLPEGRIWVGDSNTVVSDTVYLDETNERMGIGTITPDAKLEVVGTTGVIIDSGSSSAARLTLIGDGSPYGGGGIIDVIGGSSDYITYGLNVKRSPNTLEASNQYWMGNSRWTWDGNIGVTRAQPYTSYDFKTQGSSQMVIYNNNVGIGVTAPSQKLHVNGSARVTGAYYDSSNSPGAANSVLISTISGTVWGARGPLGSGTTNYLARWTPDANTLGIGVTYDDGTNVGIGTTSPGSKLTVDGTTRLGGDVEVSELLSGDKVLTLTANNGSFNIGDIDGLGGQAFISGDSSSISISANQITTLHCGSNNRVGVGTTSPQEKMHVSGASNIRLEVEATDSTVAALKLTNTAGSYASFVNASGSLSTYDYNAASTRTTLLANGNFGIGTTNPSAKLDVVQATAANGAPALHLIGPNTNSSQTSSVLVIEQGDGKKITIDGNDIDVSSGDLFINDYSLEDVTFGGQIKVKGSGTPAGDSYFENGNVGIGTTSPSYKLDVTGDAYIDETLNIESTISGTPFRGYPAVGAGNLVVGGMNFASWSPGVITLINQDTTISAGQDLGVLQFVGKDDQTNGYASSMIKGLTTFAGGGGNSGGGILSFLTCSGYSGPSERMRITNAGNVGIGATSPSEKLTVAGNISVTSPNSFLVKNGDSNHGLKYGYNTFASNPTDGPILYGWDAGGLGTKRNSENIALYWNYLGNVGIGTTTPSSKLQVNGGVQLANDTASPSASKVGTFRYRTSGNNSYVDMCMQTGASTYAWVNIVTNSW